MASIAKEPNGYRRIQFVCPVSQSRRTLRLGKLDQKTAEIIARHIESLVSSKMAGQAIPRDTAAWLSQVTPKLREKLAAVGLIEAQKQSQLGAFLRSHILQRSDVKPATLEVWQQPVRNLTEFFGEDRPLRAITAGDAEQFKAWLLTQNLASTTLAKRLSFARTFLHVARKHKLIDENPFAEITIPAANVSERQHFVNLKVVEQLLTVANPTWRMIIALCRFGGLRCPSEVLSLEWQHVD